MKKKKMMMRTVLSCINYVTCKFSNFRNNKTIHILLLKTQLSSFPSLKGYEILWCRVRTNFLFNIRVASHVFVCKCELVELVFDRKISFQLLLHLFSLELQRFSCIDISYRIYHFNTTSHIISICIVNYSSFCFEGLKKQHK